MTSIESDLQKEISSATDEGKLVLLLDASAMSASSCIKRTFLSVVEGYRGALNSNSMEFGTAFHKFRAILREHGLQQGFMRGIPEAIKYYKETPMIIEYNKKYLTEEFLAKICQEYATKYLPDDFETIKHEDEYFLELKFAPQHTVYEDELMEIILVGTIDEVGKFKGGMPAICDAKTSAVWNIQEYFRGYRLSPQLKFYRWIWREYAREYPDSIFAEIESKGVGCFIDGIFYSGADKPVQYERSEVFIYPDEELDEFGRLIELKRKELVDVVREWLQTQKYPMRYGMLNGSCETKYGKCPYFSGCAAPNEIIEKLVLAKNYRKVIYNPLTFQT